MCLWPKKQVLYKAHRPILVIKVGQKLGDVLITPYQYAPLAYSTMHHSCIKKTQEAIRQGLHSYSTNRVANINCNPYFGEKTHYALIPKGAYFCIGDSGDAVSTHLVIYPFRSKKPNYKYFDSSENWKVVLDFSNIEGFLVK